MKKGLEVLPIPHFTYQTFIHPDNLSLVLSKIGRNQPFDCQILSANIAKLVIYADDQKFLGCLPILLNGFEQDPPKGWR